LPETLLPEALAAARAVSLDAARTRSLAALAPHLPETEREAALRDALAAARAIRDDTARAAGLAALAPHLPEAEREAALRDALAAARAISDETARAEKLAALARAFSDNGLRAYYLIRLAPHLPEPEREDALRDALAAARACSEDPRARYLAELVPHLPEAPNFAQTFATRVLPKNPQLPELLFISMSRDTKINLPEALIELEAELTTTQEDSNSPELELRGLTTGGKEILETALTWHLQSGTVGQMSMFDLSNYSNVALEIIETAEIPVTASPLKGATLAALAGGGATILNLFHSGVGVTEASISILFLAGTMIIFGAAKGVARALEAGLEQKVLKMFGVQRQRIVSARREVAVKTARGSRQARSPTPTKETEAQLAETSTAREADTSSALAAQLRAAQAADARRTTLASHAP
jgi:hypothetical protein